MFQVLQDLHRSFLFLRSGQVRFEVVFLIDQLIMSFMVQRLACMKSGTNEKSWKYNSILSASVSLLVRAKA